MLKIHSREDILDCVRLCMSALSQTDATNRSTMPVKEHLAVLESVEQM